MIPSSVFFGYTSRSVYQRGWMIDSQLASDGETELVSISKGMDD